MEKSKKAANFNAAKRANEAAVKQQKANQKVASEATKAEEEEREKLQKLFKENEEEAKKLLPWKRKEIEAKFLATKAEKLLASAQEKDELTDDVLAAYAQAEKMAQRAQQLKKEAAVEKEAYEAESKKIDEELEKEKEKKAEMEAELEKRRAEEEAKLAAQVNQVMSEDKQKPEAPKAEASKAAPAAPKASAPKTSAPKASNSKTTPKTAPAASTAPKTAPDAPKASAPTPATVISCSAFKHGEGPGYAFKYWNAQARIWGMKTDLWSARQAGNGIYSPVWVWYRPDGTVDHVLSIEEIEKYCP